MLVHVTVSGKKTTVSIDDVLIDYLGAWAVEGCPSLYSKPKIQQQKAKKIIREKLVNADLNPSKNLSQFIQERIIRLIADEQLNAILEQRGDPYTPPSRKQDDHSLQQWALIAGMDKPTEEQIMANLLHMVTTRPRNRN